MTVLVNSPRSSLGHRDAVTSSLKLARSLAWFWPWEWLQVLSITSEWWSYGDTSHPGSESCNRLLWNGKPPEHGQDNRQTPLGEGSDENDEIAHFSHPLAFKKRKRDRHTQEQCWGAAITGV